jgi:hypothetical protein
LKDREYATDTEFDPKHEKTQWQRFERQVAQLNSEGAPKTQYKVIFSSLSQFFFFFSRSNILSVGRHGQGYHNVAEAFYGTQAWDCYWSLRDGNSTSTV